MCHPMSKCESVLVDGMCEQCLLKSSEGSKDMTFENFFKAITTKEDVVVDENETKKDEVVKSLKKVGVAVGVVAGGIALLGWGISKLVNGSDENMMKAPGKAGCYIKRDVFESDPKKYFRNLRK